MNVTLRSAVLGDAPALSDLARELGYPSSVPVTKERLAALARSRDDEIVVAAGEEEMPVAWMHLAVVQSLESERFAEIRGLVVTETLRGAGIGSRLVVHAESWALSHDCTVLRLRSNIVRVETHRFYESRGFAVRKTQTVFEKVLSAPRQAPES